MNNISRIICFSVLLVFICQIDLSGQFKIDAQYRPRFEVRNGYQKLAPENSVAAVSVSQRTRLSLSYESETIRLKFTPQDVRIWGDEGVAGLSGISGDTASLDLFEGYAEIRLGNAGWVSVGRQQLVLDNEWLFGARNWNQNGNSSDAIVFKLTPFGWNLHLAATWNSKTEESFNNLYPTDRYKSLNYLWLNKSLGESLKLSLLQTANGQTETDSTNGLNFRYSSGFYTDYKKSDFNILTNFYYQYGKSQPGKKVSAYLFAIDGSWKTGSFTPGIGISYHSGNDKSGTSLKTDHLFDLIFTSRHRYFGHIDYFRTLSSQTKNGGLEDYYGYLDLKLSAKLSVRNTAHYFRLVQLNPDTPDQKNLGFENDLIAKYKFSEWGVLDGGYMFFLPTEALKTIQKVPDSEFSGFFYLQMTLTPNLFKQKSPDSM